MSLEQAVQIKELQHRIRQLERRLKLANAPKHEYTRVDGKRFRLTTHTIWEEVTDEY